MNHLADPNTGKCLHCKKHWMKWKWLPNEGTYAPCPGVKDKGRNVMRLEVTVTEHGDGRYRGQGVLHHQNGHTTTFGPDAYPIFEDTAEKARSFIIQMAQENVNMHELARLHHESQIVSYEELDIVPTV